MMLNTLTWLTFLTHSRPRETLNRSSLFVGALTGLLMATVTHSPPARAVEPDWQAYQALLERHVTPHTSQEISLNWLDYTALVKDPAFDALVQQLEQFPLQQLSGRQEELAFYINAYNIFAIKMIKDHWPLTTIKAAGSWFSPVWKKEIGQLDGRPVTLHHIEHEILRKMDEPRIHFAIVCASLSCPDLLAQPYRAETLEQQLEQQVEHFLSNPGKGVVVTSKGLKISKIFDWFEEDFDHPQGVAGFIRHYRPQWPAVIDGYIEYNWQLNGE